METSYLVARLIVASASPRMANCPWKERGQASRRQRLRSSSTTDLAILRVSHATLGSRAFVTSATSACNSISHNTWSSSSLITFRSHLSYRPLWLFSVLYVRDLEVLVRLWHVNDHSWYYYNYMNFGGHQLYLWNNWN